MKHFFKHITFTFSITICVLTMKGSDIFQKQIFVQPPSDSLNVKSDCRCKETKDSAGITYFKNKKFSGVCKNGKLSFVYYKNGRILKTIIYNENGNKSAEAVFDKNGIEIMEKSYFTNGEIETIETLLKDSLVRTVTYDKNGNKTTTKEKIKKHKGFKF